MGKRKPGKQPRRPMGRHPCRMELPRRQKTLLLAGANAFETNGRNSQRQMAEAPLAVLAAAGLAKCRHAPHTVFASRGRAAAGRRLLSSRRAACACRELHRIHPSVTAPQPMHASFEAGEAVRYNVPQAGAPPPSPPSQPAAGGQVRQAGRQAGRAPANAGLSPRTAGEGGGDTCGARIRQGAVQGGRSASGQPRPFVGVWLKARVKQLVST
ncbi:MAG: hypothetical protein J3K34DRAFT_409400 [Monoraphidium minutum]|nr:MAG: hypothetical protein J3K34DRAFT_409400 [Monoraphidium minutum]